MRKPHILMVEDEQNICDFNREYLEGQGYEVSVAATLYQARFLLEEHTPDLILLDVMLPDGRGWDFCTELRQKTNAPVIFLTSRNENESVIKGLMQGGDDYIHKPYDLAVLGARVAVQLRRAGIGFAGRIDLPPLSIDILSGTVDLEGSNISLPPKELQLLCCLALAAGRRVSGAELYRRTWGVEAGDWEHIVSVNISRLRKHLGLNEGSAFEISCTQKKDYILRKTRFT